MKEAKEVRETLTQHQVRHNIKNYPPMPLAKTRAFLEVEFPWIAKYVGWHPSRVFVSRITPGLLEYKPEFFDKFPNDYFSKWDYYEKILLLDEHGEQVLLQKPVSQMYRRFLIGPLRVTTTIKTIGSEVEQMSTIGETLNLLENKASAVRFILSFFRETYTVIVYKLPKEFTIAKWVQAQIDVESAKLKVEIKKIERETI